MLWLFRWLVYGPTKKNPTCKEGGPHNYRARYDEMLDPRLSEKSIVTYVTSSSYHPIERRHASICKIYVKDICDTCGDTVERLEGLNAMQVIAYASKRIND